MSKYIKPNLERPIKDLQKEIEHDFNKMARTFNLPLELQFDAVVRAVQIGMVPRVNYPFRKLQNSFMDYLLDDNSFNLNEDEVNEALQTFVAVWNHFPHDDLGMSPNEKMREEKKKNPKMFRMPSIGNIADDLNSEDYLEELDKNIISLSNIAKDIFEIHLKAIGGTKKDLGAIITILEDPKKYPGDALTYMLEAVSKNARKKKRKLLMEETQPAVRALAMCENYTASKMPNGHYNSRIFQDIAQQTFENMEAALADGGEIIEPIVPFDMLGHSHACIAQEGDKLNACNELQESAHHILDWLALTDINEVMAHAPRGIALLVLGVAHLISKTVEPKLALGCGAKRIQSAIKGTVKKDAYEKEINRLAKKALCNCKDPFLMLASLTDAPDDWENRLSKIAPCLKLRSPVKPSDLPIPSPF